MSYRTRGFTLLEFAAVLTIIGLMLGAIMLRRDFVRGAELQSVMTDVDRYQTAMQSFLDKYQALPGDYRWAFIDWGEDNGCLLTPANHVPKVATCGGNGDTIIGDINGSVLGGATIWYESYRVWQHLTDSGFLTGSYTGALSDRTVANDIDPGMNVPASRIRGAAFTVLHAAPGPAVGVFSANYNHIFVFGAPAGAHASAYNPALSAAEAQSLDAKMDDGLPGQGKVLTFTPDLAGLQNCATSNVQSSALYQSTTTGVQCSLIFITGF